MRMISWKTKGDFFRLSYWIRFFWKARAFPEILGIAERFKAQVLHEYFNVMLYRDLVERYEIMDVTI